MAAPNAPRKRLRPWLIDQINSSNYRGLEWINKEKMTFKIPWKHFGRPGVDEQMDAMLFRNYAIHTKKYKEGEPADVSTWKTRFRCALHKHPGIKEIHSLNQTEGDEPYRVYQFIDKEPDNDYGGQSPASFSSTNPMVANSPSIPSNSPYPNYGLSIDEIEETLRGEFENSVDSHTFQSGMFNHSAGTSAGIEEELELPLSPEDMDLVNNLLGGDENVELAASYNVNTPPYNNLPPYSQASQEINQTQINELPIIIKLYYADQVVGEHKVSNPRGLRIAFNPPPPLPNDVIGQPETTEVVSHIFGPFQAEQIYFPAATDERTTAILRCIKRGLVFQARNGEIHATRLCQVKVFYSDSATPNAEVKELRREHTTKVFDYVHQFLPAYREYVTNIRDRAPSYELFFCFGQKWSATTTLRNNYVYVSVVHALAQQMMRELRVNSDNILVSDPNMLDIIANQIEDLSLNNQVLAQSQVTMAQSQPSPQPSPQPSFGPASPP